MGGFYDLRLRRSYMGGFFEDEDRRDWDFVLRSWEIEDPLHIRRTPPIFEEVDPPSSGRSSDRSSWPKIVDGGGSSMFGAEDRRLKIGGFFVLRLRRSKVGGSSLPKIEDGGFFEYFLFFEDGGTSKNPPIFDLRFRRSKNPTSTIFGADDWAEDCHRPRGGLKFAAVPGW